MRKEYSSRKSLVTAASISIALVLGGCAGRPSQGVLVPVAQAAEGTSRVDMLIATTRKRSTADAGEMFSGERADDLSYAAISISIPSDNSREIGKINCLRPFRVILIAIL